MQNAVFLGVNCGWHSHFNGQYSEFMIVNRRYCCLFVTPDRDGI